MINYNIFLNFKQNYYIYLSGDILEGIGDLFSYYRFFKYSVFIESKRRSNFELLITYD